MTKGLAERGRGGGKCDDGKRDGGEERGGCGLGKREERKRQQEVKTDTVLERERKQDGERR